MEPMSAGRLRFTSTTLLGENTEEMLVAACRLLARDGIEISLDAATSWERRKQAALSGDIDLLWVCGLLGTRLIDSGRLPGTVRLAPVFDRRSRPVYQSVIIARTGRAYASLADVAGACLAVNEYGSWSGYAALVEHLRRHRRSIDIFSTETVTGSHAASVLAVQDGHADVAAIDDSVWHWLARSGRTDRLTVIDRTGSWPAPPLVIGHRVDEHEAERLVDALAGLPRRSVEGLDHFEPVSDTDYDTLREVDRDHGAEGLARFD